MRKIVSVVLMIGCWSTASALDPDENPDFLNAIDIDAWGPGPEAEGEKQHFRSPIDSWEELAGCHSHELMVECSCAMCNVHPLPACSLKESEDLDSHINGVFIRTWYDHPVKIYIAAASRFSRILQELKTQKIKMYHEGEITFPSIAITYKGRRVFPRTADEGKDDSYFDKISLREIVCGRQLKCLGESEGAEFLFIAPRKIL